MSRGFAAIRAGSLRACLGLLLLGAGAALAAAPAAIPSGKLPENAAPTRYALQLRIDPRQDSFGGEVRIRVALAAPSERLWLHARDIRLGAFAVSDAQGRQIPARAILHPQQGMLEVRFEKSLPEQELELSIAYEAPFNRKLEGLYKVEVGEDAYALTQMEPISARFAFPGFDEPRFKTPFDLSLTVPASAVALANTRPIGEEKSADGRWKTLRFATTKPLPTYLIAFAVGPWEVVEGKPIAPNAVRKEPLPLRGIGPRGSRGRFAWALETAAEIVPFFEHYTAQAYPFDKLDLLAAPDFSAGAMENAGLIIYRDAALLSDQHSPAERFRGVFGINAHEIAHQWYGDLVTVPWWDDIWLNEAFATWGANKAALALHPEYRNDLSSVEGRGRAMGEDSLLSARRIRQPIEGDGDIQTAFDGITYAKGASVLSMFEHWVGEETFREGMRRYLARRAFGSGSSDDLIAALAAASGKGEAFATSMRSFLDQPGIPLISARLECGDRGAKLALAQSRYLPFGVRAAGDERWSLPVCLRYGRAGGSDTQCVLLDQAAQHYPVAGTCPEWLLPNADARGYYRFDAGAEGFAALGAASAQLAPAEQLVYADALGAGLFGGGVAPAAVLDAMPGLAGSPLPQVATALVPAYQWISKHALAPAQRAALADWAATLYRPRMDELGWRARGSDSSETRALRTRLAELLALTLHDPAARAALAAQGRAALALDGAARGVDLRRAEPDLLESALKVTVQDGGEAAFEAARRAFEASRVSSDRYALLAALGSSTDPSLAAKARDYGLSAAVQLGEMARLYEAQMAQPENRAATWRWLGERFEAYRVRLSPFAQYRMPATFAEGRCSAAEAEQLDAFFAPRLAGLIGGERGLRQTLERVRQCAALREHVDRAALGAWLQARVETPSAR